MRAAIYARYSGDKQREASIDDQVRNCVRHAERASIPVIEHYHDRAISGATSARPAYQRMLADAATKRFDVLLVDDLSRLSRDDYELKGVLRRFVFQQLRVIGVSDGYDSTMKGHKIHSGFKGLVNEIFLDDLRERTHRGMTGQALKGYNCGGRTYGYRNVPIEDAHRKDAYGRPAVVAVRYEIDESQATIVRRIHERFAAGCSYATIAHELNRERITSSRGGTWATTAIKVVLENPMYEGRVVWNRRAWLKHPDTGKRTYQTRPPDEWVTTTKPELRIVPEQLVEAVRARQRANARNASESGIGGPRPKYLFSGLLACAECGGSFTMVAGNRYGCSNHKTRGQSVCRNDMTVSRLIVEGRLLAGIKAELNSTEHANTFKEVAQRLIDEQGSATRANECERQLKSAERTRHNLIEAIKQGIVTPSTKSALKAAEAEIESLKATIEQQAKWNVAAILPRAIDRYHEAVEQLEERIHGHVEPAREILRSILGSVVWVHARGDHLEAELPNHVPGMLAKSLNLHVDPGGCGGPQRFGSNAIDLTHCNPSAIPPPKFISLAPTPRDSVPFKYRAARGVIHPGGRKTSFKQRRRSHAVSGSRPSKI